MSSSTVYYKRFKDGWGYLYPDPGWLPCPVDCKLCKASAHRTRPLVESYERFPSKLAVYHFLTDNYREVEEWKPKSDSGQPRRGNP